MDLTNAVAIAAGHVHSLALTADGRVVGWGGNTLGQATPPADLTNAVAVAAGDLHSLALRADGTVVAWGYNCCGQTDVPAGLTNILAIAAGSHHNLALRSDYTVVAWGTNDHGQINVPTGLTEVRAIAAGKSHSLALRMDGSVVAWGDNNYGQTAVPPDLGTVIAIAAGSLFSLALKTDGTVVAWGQTVAQTNFPATLMDVTAIAAGGNFSLALRSDGSVAAWGLNLYGATTPPPGLSNVVAVAAGLYHGLALTGEFTPIAAAPFLQQAIGAGTIFVVDAQVAGTPPLTYRWELNGDPLPNVSGSSLVLTNFQASQAGVYTIIVSNEFGSTTLTRLLQVIPGPPLITSQPVSQTNFVGTDVELRFIVQGSEALEYQWLFNGTEMAGATGSVLRLYPLRAGQGGEYSVVVRNPLGIAVSSNANLSVVQVAAWGRGDEGQTIVPPNLTNVLAIAAGGYHSLATKTDGTVVGWGNNDFGQTTAPPGLSNVVGLTATTASSVALKADGSVSAWGDNTYGQTDIPSDLTNVTWVAAGDRRWAALRADGRLSLVPGPTPPSFSNIVAAAVGPPATYAVKEDGSVITDSGQKVTGLTNVLSISVGVWFGVALMANGTVVAWGINYGGGGIGPVDGYTNVVAADAGAYNTLLLLADGTVVNLTWDGSDTVPSGLSNVVAISAGGFHNLALIGDGSPAFVHRPARLSTYTGHTLILNAGAVGAQPMNYQWRLNGVEIPGATSSYLELTDAQINQNGIYTVAVSNRLNSALSAGTEVTLRQSPPLIVLQPTSKTTYPGAITNFQVTVEGSLPFAYQWLFNGVEIPGAANDTLTLTNILFSDQGIYSVRVSNAFGAATSAGAVLTIPELVAWGDYHGGPNEPYGDAYAPAGLTNVVAMASGYYHGLALKGDGTVAAWGPGFVGWWPGGQNLVPPGLSNVVAIAAGGYHNLALKDDGTLVAWGDNSYGQTNLPGGMTNLVAVAAGEYHTAAVRADGTVVCWGERYAGSALTNVPQGLSNVVAIAADHSHTLALRDDGTVVAWGYGTSTNVPSGLTNVVAIAAGWYNHSMAVRADGTVTEWGRVYDPLPGNVSNAVSVSAGDLSQYALRADGTVVGSGYISPPPGLTNSVAIASFYENGLALVSRHTIVRVKDLPMARLRWLSSSDAPWFAQTNVIYEGQDALQSAAIARNQESRLETIVWGPGGLSFWWKVSSRKQHDWLRFYMDGVEVARISGEEDWQRVVFGLPPGIHTMAWVYSRSKLAPRGQDAAWLDSVRWTPRASP